jgi:lysozyme family protein
VADLNQAIQKTLVHEGGYVNNPNDKGGPTKYGITQADMPGVDMSTISQIEAIAYYREHYWKDLYSQINSQLVAEKLFDMGVLMGVGTAVKLLQVTIKNRMMIVPDGVFGPQTLADVNLQRSDELLSCYRVTLLNHAVNIAGANPKDSEFIQGWITRINS